MRHTQKMVHMGATALLTSLAPCASDAKEAVKTCTAENTRSVAGS